MATPKGARIRRAGPRVPRGCARLIKALEATPNKELHPKEIVKRTGMSRASVDKMIERAVKCGFVRQVNAPSLHVHDNVVLRREPFTKSTAEANLSRRLMLRRLYASRHRGV